MNDKDLQKVNGGTLFTESHSHPDKTQDDSEECKIAGCSVDEDTMKIMKAAIRKY